jgi:hypothetical protein
MVGWCSLILKGLYNMMITRRGFGQALKKARFAEPELQMRRTTTLSLIGLHALRVGKTESPRATSWRAGFSVICRC